MRVLSLTYGSRGDVDPIMGVAVRLQALGAEVRECAPPAASVRQVAELVAAQFDTVAAVAEGCDVLVAGGMIPAGAWL